MAEITLEPTPLSKVIPISLKVNETDAKEVTRLATKKQFNTSDTDAWLSFTLEGLTPTSGVYDLTMVNVDEKPIGSIVHHTNVAFSTIPFHYKLDSGADLLTNEIRHAGRWIGQIVVRLANGDTTSRQFDFAISGHLLDRNEARLILIEDYNSLIATITASKDELTQYNIDYSTLLTDINAAKVAMDQAEIDRQATFDALVDSEMIAQNVATKLAEKEATFAPRMLSLENELAEKINVDKIDFYYPNLFFPALAVSGFLNKTNGGISASASLSTSDFIPVSEGEKITYFDRNNETGGTVDLACFYGSGKVLLSAVSNPTNQINTVTVPAGAAYFRFTYRNTYANGVKVLKGGSYETPKQKADWIDVSGASRFNGKTFAFLGDSISYGYGLVDRMNERFQTLVWKRLSLASASDYGVSGTLIALKAGVTSSFVERYPTMSDNVDVIIVMGGINDYYNGTGELGAVDSVDTKTFNGALNVLMTGLKNKYPTKEIIFMTPLSGNKNTVGSSNKVNLHAGATLNDYRNAIISRARYHCIPVLDLYTLSGFDFAENQLHRDNFAPDGIHPNAAGHKRIADKIIGFMKSF